MIDKSLCFYWELENRRNILIEYSNTLVSLLDERISNGNNYINIRQAIVSKTSVIKEIVEATYIEQYIINRSTAFLQRMGRMPKFSINYTQDFISMVEDEEQQLAIEIIDFYHRLIGYLEYEINKRKNLFSLLKTVFIRIIYVVFRWPAYILIGILAILFGASGINKKNGLISGLFGFFYNLTIWIGTVFGIFTWIIEPLGYKDTIINWIKIIFRM
jgi:hypothetical protein